MFLRVAFSVSVNLRLTLAYKALRLVWQQLHMPRLQRGGPCPKRPLSAATASQASWALPCPEGGLREGNIFPSGGTGAACPVPHGPAGSTNAHKRQHSAPSGSRLPWRRAGTLKAATRRHCRQCSDVENRRIPAPPAQAAAPLQFGDDFRYPPKAEPRGRTITIPIRLRHLPGPESLWALQPPATAEAASSASSSVLGRGRAREGNGGGLCDVGEGPWLGDEQVRRRRRWGGRGRRCR